MGRAQKGGAKGLEDLRRPPSMLEGWMTVSKNCVCMGDWGRVGGVEIWVKQIVSHRLDIGMVLGI